jgi:flagellar hook assembly protein FlgD
MFELPTRAKVQIKVYNIIGSEVATIANDEFDSGLHSVNFDANNLPAGNYIVKMTTSSFTKSIKVTLIK